MTAPTLFDQLATTDRLGVNPGSFCSADRRLLDLWAEHGIPADLSTVEGACRVLMRLWVHHREVEAAFGELLDRVGGS